MDIKMITVILKYFETEIFMTQVILKNFTT